MTKEFTKWNTQKILIHERGMQKFYHVREVWWCSLGVNVGFEQDGGGEENRRPVVILKGLSKDICLVVPLTRSSHTHKYRISAGLVDGESASAIISQMRVIDTRRLVRKIEFLDRGVFEIIRKAARDML